MIAPAEKVGAHGEETMWKNPYSAQRRRIQAFAVAWAKADMGPGYHAHGGMARGVRVSVITDYATSGWHSMGRCRGASTAARR